MGRLDLLEESLLPIRSAFLPPEEVGIGTGWVGFGFASEGLVGSGRDEERESEEEACGELHGDCSLGGWVIG